MLKVSQYWGSISPFRSCSRIIRYASTAPNGAESLTDNERSIDTSLLFREKTKFQLKKYKPISPGLRHLQRPITENLWKKGPYRPLTEAKRKTGGRNDTGRITVRHIGGGHKQRIRLVDFKRISPGPCKVLRIEYDPGRSGHIALIESLDEEKRKSYILACDGLQAGDTVESFRHLMALDKNGKLPVLSPTLAAELEDGTFAARNLKPGNCFPLRLIPVGTVIHAIGVQPGQKAKLCRSAGSSARLIAFDDKNYAIVRLQSGEERKILATSFATIGTVSNIYWQHRQLGKAGRSRWLGIRPTVRGTAMNACDHPHGGGGGKRIGNKPSQSPTGVLAKGGYKTRKGKNVNKLLVRSRPRGKDKR
ncbi:ribosomal protein subunit L2 [Schizosaccharomyces octosporus yFS286]|uniref:Large ribosomal subunit protein uL2m n=1 Tax=Schizosaccharomyces octosporus (strain yFS286) TaxID=483514 RepID=S9PS19_SCHOY|nr:ribosomal protein subunit L2 [Schizosaccharomyces octosporus yFS286]EPX71966.1 ribosomal protein subunit L2 [Schizosaccharomyces octosporus yFS286]